MVRQRDYSKPGTERTSLHAAGSFADLLDSLEATWRQVSGRYLPVTSSDGNAIWRYSRAVEPGDPEQGWKLHVSATILSASDVLQRVAPLLRDGEQLFKATSSLVELKKLNCGLFYGFSQVGKFLTIYPRTTAQAISLALALHELTREFPGPRVPFDAPLCPGSRVSYRYGAFSSTLSLPGEGAAIGAIRTPAGDLVPDERGPGAAVPPWLRDADPFVALTPRFPVLVPADSDNPLRTRFRAYEAVIHRGKGGVYHAIDLGTDPPRRCLLKEGRRHGETDIDGRDGHWRLRHESRVLAGLAAAGIPVPAVYDAFTVDGHAYLATELIAGRTLQDMLFNRARRLPLRRALPLGIRIARLVAAIHAAGWVWRDCKPLNLLVEPGGTLRPIDFEGASPVADPDPAPWGTSGYVAPEWAHPPLDGDRIPEDLFALGVTLHQLLTGVTPGDAGPRAPLEFLRPRALLPLKRVVTNLMSDDPAARPAAADVAQTLEHVLSALPAEAATHHTARPHPPRAFARDAVLAPA